MNAKIYCMILILAAMITCFACTGSTTTVKVDGDESPTDGDDTSEIDVFDPPSCASFTLIKGETLPPAVVKLFYQLSDCDGNPLPGVGEDHFTIEENGETVSELESKMRIVQDHIGFELATVLLLDMSGSILLSGDLEALQFASRLFVDKLGDTQLTAIYYFDGREELQPLILFTKKIGRAHV